MRARRYGTALAALLLLTASICPSPLGAQSAIEFFKGRTLKLTIGTGPGGGYDLYARMLAPHFEQRLGAKVVVGNRPGASHMAALNAVLAAPPDGLNLTLASAEGAVLGRLLGEPGVRFDLTAFPIIARVNTAPRILIVNPGMPYTSLSELKSSGRILTMGFTGPTDGGADTAAIMCHAVRLNCRLIIGYPSSKEFSLAAIRGEVDGTAVTEDSAVRFSDSGQLTALAVIARTRSTLAPHVPTIFEAASISADDAMWLDLRDDIRKLGRLLVTTPGTPADRLEALQAAARAILTDEVTKKEFFSRGMPVEFAAAGEMLAIIGRLLGGGLPGAKLRELKHIVTKKYYN